MLALWSKRWSRCIPSHSRGTDSWSSKSTTFREGRYVLLKKQMGIITNDKIMQIFYNTNFLSIICSVFFVWTSPLPSNLKIMFLMQALTCHKLFSGIIISGMQYGLDYCDLLWAIILWLSSDKFKHLHVRQIYLYHYVFVLVKQ